MSQLVDYINNSEDWPLEVETIIDKNGWESDCGEAYGVCHDATEKIIINEHGRAELI